MNTCRDWIHSFCSFWLSLTIGCWCCCLIWRMNRRKCHALERNEKCSVLVGIVDGLSLPLKCMTTGTITTIATANPTTDKRRILIKPIILGCSIWLLRREEEFAANGLEREREERALFYSKRQWEDHWTCSNQAVDTEKRTGRRMGYLKKYVTVVGKSKSRNEVHIRILFSLITIYLFPLGEDVKRGQSAFVLLCRK